MKQSVLLDEPATHGREPAECVEAGLVETVRPEPDRLRRQAVRGGLIVMVSRLGTQVFIWASTLLVFRYFLPEDLGVLTMGVIFVNLVNMLAEAGIGRALIQKAEVTPRDLHEGFTLTSLLSLAGYGLLFLIAPTAESLLDIDGFAFFMRILALNLLFIPFKSIPLAILDRRIHMGKQSFIHVITAVLQAGLVLVLAVCRFGYWSQAIGSLAASALEASCLVWISGYRPRLTLLSSRGRALWMFGIHVSIGTLLWEFYSNVDFPIVGYMVGNAALGFYALAFQLITIPADKITANINKVAYPAFCRLQNDPQRLRDWFLRLMVLLGFFGMPVTVGMALVAGDGIGVVLGDKWHAAVVPFQLLCLAGLIRVYAAALPPLFNAMGRPDISLKYTAFCALVFPGCFWGAAWTAGVAGVCLVWTVMYPLIVGGLVVVTRRLTGFGLWDILKSQCAIFTGVLFMAAVVLTGQWLTSELDAKVRLAVAIALGIAAYTIAMLALTRRTVLADLRGIWAELKGKKRPLLDDASRE